MPDQIQRHTLPVAHRSVFYRLADVAAKLKAVWRAWSLARQFLICASIVLMPAMLIIGSWVSNRIEESVASSAGTSAALYMENFVEPLVQDLVKGTTITDENRVSLNELLAKSSLGDSVISFKIWSDNGTVLASNRADLIGRRFPPSVRLTKARAGVATAEFDILKDEENAFEKHLGLPLLELYIPLRARGSEKVIAVGEFYQDARELRNELTRAKRWSWLIVAGVTLSMLATLFAIVWRGSQTIESQRKNLEKQVAELTNLLSENRRLRRRAQGASARVTEGNESYLRRLGADLHDGPAQLISLALLRADDSRAAGADAGGKAGTSLTTLRSVLDRALNEIRNIAAGLVVPEIDGLALKETLQTVVRRHEQLTNTRVDLRCIDLPEVVPNALKLCAYRFVQEGLANAHRHAGGKGQTVTAQPAERAIVITVSDNGDGMQDPADNRRRSLGLSALTDRIESLGGTLTIDSQKGHGTKLTARLPLFAGAHESE